MSKETRQKTLFQSWGPKPVKKNDVPNFDLSITGSEKTDKDKKEIIELLDDDEDEDQDLARALEESLACHQQENDYVKNSLYGRPPVPLDEDTCDLSFGIEEQDDDNGINRNHCLSQWRPTDRPVGELNGYDSAAGRLWIYPTNYPVREYQFTIVKQALLKNTLVTLPTGLGKTFIASVIMYNFYRWYPEGKVIFMAPTKPLVAQQIDACYHIMGIPRDDTAEMTGINILSSYPFQATDVIHKVSKQNSSNPN